MTPTPLGTGPQVVFLGVITNFDGCVFCCDATCKGQPTPTPARDAQHRRVYNVKSGKFLIVVEGVIGASEVKAGTSLDPLPPDNRPDLQIENTQNMGSGIPDGACGQNGGGIPGVNPPSFDPNNPLVTVAFNEFACRFDKFVSAAFPCTYIDDSGIQKLVTPGATSQFCDFVNDAAAFPPGESLVTVKLRDEQGALGPTAQIVVRVATLTPTRTPTPTSTKTPTRTPTRTPTPR